MVTSSFHTNYNLVTIRTIDGSTIQGKINIGSKERLSDLFSSAGNHFIVVSDVLIKDVHIKTIFINKQHIVWVEPEE